jgi:CheY-like chemotaxis protein
MTMNNAVNQILLIEDDEWDVDLIKNVLSEMFDAGQIAVVGNGADALDYLYRRGVFESRATANPLFVLSDNKMPKVDGIEVLRTMKADDNFRAIPFIVFSSSRELSDVEEFYRSGVNAYVIKPTNIEDFKTIVTRVASVWGDMGGSAAFNPT